ncbi:DUF4190 domain-containing protein [Streptomyces sp. NPDC005374]|uniref:DUF4190 domain-containing protein n=1 Tax=Streptomyces sp. NPDC005374 TaxID=3364713 RepID=UPI0036A12786
MTDASQSGGEAGAGRDPWAPPESGPSLEKSQSPGADQPPSVHDQATVTSVPNDGYGYPAPEQGVPGSVPPPPIAPGGPAGYGYPGYPQGYGGWPTPPVPPQNGMGVAAMVLGILSCALFCMYGVLSLILGVLAIIFGVKGRKRAERGEATNHGQAQAGFIMGIIGTILGVAIIALMAVVITTAINSDDEPDYYDGSLPAFGVAQQL